MRSRSKLQGQTSRRWPGCVPASIRPGIGAKINEERVEHGTANRYAACLLSAARWSKRELHAVYGWQRFSTELEWLRPQLLVRSDGTVADVSTMFIHTAGFCRATSYVNAVFVCAADALGAAAYV